MRHVALLTCVAIVFSAGFVSAESLQGDYLEARNCSVWAGPCIVNAEMGLAGNMATLAWKVDRGSFEGTELNGLSIVAVVFGDRTFGIGEPVKTRTIFLVDERADETKRAALVKMAKALAGDTIQEVQSVKPAKIKVEIAHGGMSLVDAGMAKVRTRKLHRSDSLCGTDQKRMSYPSLTKISDESAAYTLENAFTGSDVPVKTFEDRNVPSAVTAHFAL